MHTYRLIRIPNDPEADPRHTAATGAYTEAWGVFAPGDSLRPVKACDSEMQAQALVSYLNGGVRPGRILAQLADALRPLPDDPQPTGNELAESDSPRLGVREVRLDDLLILRELVSGAITDLNPDLHLDLREIETAHVARGECMRARDLVSQLIGGRDE